MIRYVSRKLLDEKKYNFCIENALQSRVYAFSWYLDIVADNWDVLVLNDYEAVMPLPWQQKFGLKYITQPYFCQQLGIFSLAVISEETQIEFIRKIPSKFLKVNYQFNSENTLENRNGVIKTNYILQLNENYQTLKSKYRKDRKYRVNQALKKDFTISTCTSNELVTIAKCNYDFLNLSNEAYEKLIKLMDFSIQKNKGFIKAVYCNNELSGGSFFLKSNQRIIYLFSVMNKEGEKNNIHSLIVNDIINKYSNDNFILDFEGSIIPSIASFYKSFGAKPEKYFLFKRNLLSIFSF